MAKNYEDRKENGEGNVRKLPSGKYECVVQSKYINPKTGKPKRIKRVGETEKAAREKAKLDLVAWEKEIERDRDTKINKAKTFGEYMSEYIETEVKPNITGSGYHTYINNMNRNFFDFPISKYQLHMLNAVEFERYFDTILELKSKKTCSLPMQLCKRCCKWLVDRSLLKIVKKYSRQKTFRNFIMPTKIIWDSIRLLYYFYWKQGLESENLPL